MVLQVRLLLVNLVRPRLQVHLLLVVLRLANLVRLLQPGLLAVRREGPVADLADAG